MTNADSIADIITALGGTPSGASNAGLLAELVTALGGTPEGTTNAELIQEIADAYADATENLAAGNIKKGVTILGVTGTYEGRGRREARPPGRAVGTLRMYRDNSIA